MEIANLRIALSDSLQSVAAKTEGIFLSLSATFPALIKAMRESFESRGGEFEVKSSVINIGAIEKSISETFDMVNLLNKNFTDSFEKDRAIYEILDTQIEAIKVLSSHIDQIREDSSAMELISLNAMTVALKAGSSGRAFSFITEELKRLSTKTIELTQTVIEQGGIILKQFSEFSGKLKANSKLENEMFSNFTSRAHESFDSFTQGLEQIVDSYVEMKEKSKTVLQPMMKIMEEIQKQDLIRQSIDHIVISLDEIRESTHEQGSDAELDDYAFLKNLPTLCIAVLRDIKSLISDSSRVFREQVSIAQKSIDLLERDRKKLIERTLNSQNEQSIERLFKNSTKLMDDLFGDVEHVFTGKRRTVESSKDMVKKVLFLDEIFRSFASLTTRFHTIDVASRIEIAKQEVLKQMSGTVDEMTRLTTQIEADVEKSRDVTSNFLMTVQDSLENYRNLFIHQNYTAGRNLDKLKIRFNQLLGEKNELIGQMSNLKIFDGKFLNSFEESNKHLRQVDDLVLSLENVENELEQIREGAEKIFNDKLKERGLKEWRLKNEKLKTVIQRFTIFTHKKAAGELGGFEVESGSSAGEVTLF